MLSGASFSSAITEPGTLVNSTVTAMMAMTAAKLRFILRSSLRSFKGIFPRLRTVACLVSNQVNSAVHAVYHHQENIVLQVS